MRHLGARGQVKVNFGEYFYVEIFFEHFSFVYKSD